MGIVHIPYMSLMVRYFLHSTSVLSFCIDVVLTLSNRRRYVCRKAIRMQHEKEMGMNHTLIPPIKYEQKYNTSREMWFVYLCFIVCMLWALIYQPYILSIFVGSFTGTGAIIYDYPGISKLTVNDIGKVARYLNTTKQNSLDCVNDTKEVQCKEEVISISLSLKRV